jgi:hypothetical protein
MENKFLIIGVKNNELAKIVARSIAKKCNLIVSIEEGSKFKGFRLYADKVERNDEEVSHIKGYALGVFDTLTSSAFHAEIE